MLTFCPVTRAGAEALRAGDVLDLAGQAATGALRTATGLPAGEEADFAALGYAGVTALLGGAAEPRLVLAVDAEPARVRAGDDPFGSVRVRGVRWADVLALYLDPPEATAPVAVARRTVADLATGDPDPAALAAALDRPAVVAVLEEVDLLWFDPGELDTLP